MLDDIDPDREVTSSIHFASYDLWTPTLSGTWNCDGATVLEGLAQDGAYRDEWRVVVTPQQPGALKLQISRYTKFTTGTERTCTLTATQTHL